MTKLLGPRDVSRICGSFTGCRATSGNYLNKTFLIARRTLFGGTALAPLKEDEAFLGRKAGSFENSCHLNKTSLIFRRSYFRRTALAPANKNKTFSRRRPGRNYDYETATKHQRVRPRFGAQVNPRLVSRTGGLDVADLPSDEVPNEDVQFKRILEQRSGLSISDHDYETLWRQMQQDISLNRELAKAGQLQPFTNPEYAAASYQLLLMRLDLPFQRYRRCYDDTLECLMDLGRDNSFWSSLGDSERRLAQRFRRKTRTLRTERREIMNLTREVKDMAKITDSIITREAIYFEHITRLATFKTNFHRVDTGWQAIHEILYLSGSGTPRWATSRLPALQLFKWILEVKQAKAQLKDILDGRLVRSNAALYHFKKAIDFYHEVSRNGIAAQAAMDRLQKFYWNLAASSRGYEHHLSWMRAWTRRTQLEMIELASVYRSILLYIAAHVREKYQYQESPDPESEKLPDYVIRGLALQRHIANLPALPYPKLRPLSRDVFQLTERTASEKAIYAEAAALAPDLVQKKHAGNHRMTVENDTQESDSARTPLDDVDPLMDDADIPDIGFTYREMSRFGERSSMSTTEDNARQQWRDTSSQAYVVGTKTLTYAALLRERNAERKRNPQTTVQSSYGSFRRRSKVRPRNYGRLLQRFQGVKVEAQDASDDQDDIGMQQAVPQPMPTPAPTPSTVRDRWGTLSDLNSDGTFVVADLMAQMSSSDDVGMQQAVVQSTSNTAQDRRGTSSDVNLDETLVVADLMAQMSSLEETKQGELNKNEESVVSTETVPPPVLEVQPGTVARSPLRSLVDVFNDRNSRYHKSRSFVSLKLQQKLKSRGSKARAKELISRRGDTTKQFFRRQQSGTSSPAAQALKELQQAMRSEESEDMHLASGETEPNPLKSLPSPFIVLYRQRWREKIVESTVWVEFVYRQLKKALYADSVLATEVREDRQKLNIRLTKLEKLEGRQLLRWTMYVKAHSAKSPKDEKAASETTADDEVGIFHTTGALFEQLRRLRKRALELEEASLANTGKRVTHRERLETVLEQEADVPELASEIEVKAGSSLPVKAPFLPLDKMKKVIGEDAHAPQSAGLIRNDRGHARHKRENSVEVGKAEEAIQLDKRPTRLGRLRRVLSQWTSTESSQRDSHFTQSSDGIALSATENLPAQDTASALPSLSDAEPSSRQCPSCGYKNDENTSTCRMCDRLLGDAHKEATASTFSVGLAPASQDMSVGPATSIVRKTIPKRLNDIDDEREWKSQLGIQLRRHPTTRLLVRKFVPRALQEIDDKRDQHHQREKNQRLRQKIRTELWERSATKQHDTVRV